MKWLKRFILVVLAAVGLGFLVLGAAAPTAVPSGFVIVNYWEKWVGPEAEQMQLIVNDFNNSVGKEKHIFVRFLSVSNIDQKTLVATAAGVPPDIAGLWDQQVSQYAALGAVQPLDELAKAQGITEQTYLPVYWNGCKYDGQLYAMVSTPAAIALLYNKQIFQECAKQLRDAGCDPNRAPRTLAELDRYSQAIETHYANNQIDRAGYVPLQSWYVPFTCYWFGGDLFDSSSHQFLLTSEPSVKAYEWIASYSQRLGARTIQDFCNTHLLSNFDSPQNPFLTGKLAMQQQGPWMANYIQHLKPSMSAVLVPKDREKTLPRREDNYAWAVAPFPSAVAGLDDASFCTFDVLMIPVGARHPNEAFEFMAYVNRQDVAEKLCTLHCKNTQLRKVSEHFLQNHPNPYIDVFQKLAASPNAHGVPPVPIWPEVFKELTDDSQAVAIQGADPRAVLTASQNRLQAEYDHFREIQNKRQQLGAEE
jgi:ABC-type glycerol-3-phosphate transport system substrate-binding protein